MFSETILLQQLGLSIKEAEIYQVLLDLGNVQVSRILPKIKLKRTTVYSILEELKIKGLVERDDSRGVSLFRAKHPYALKEFVDSRLNSIKMAESKLDAVLPSFVNLYTGQQNRPGVKFYEGSSGVWQVLQDTLTSRTEVLTIVDVEAVDKYVKELNQKYIKLRNKKKIKKRLLVLDTPYARRFFHDLPAPTDVKFCQLEIVQYNTSIQIYDNKITYITMTDDSLTSTLINDRHIYAMQKALFEFVWKKI